jgi:glucose-6-phosphate dehydrogenase assembly protein OpcA
MSASGSAAKRLPSVARSLLLGDLPTALWWCVPQAPPLGGPMFDELSQMADQVIYESMSWPDPVSGMTAVAEWVNSERTEQVVADLQWRRLKLWRRLISQALSPEVLPGAMESITEIRLEHGPHSLTQAWLLVGWLASRLGWQPAHGRAQRNVEIDWSFRSTTGPIKITVRRRNEGNPEVTGAVIRWKTKDGPGQAKFEVIGPERLQVRVNDGETRILTAPPQSRASLVARQLPDLERDPLFRETLKHAGAMAAALL